MPPPNTTNPTASELQRKELLPSQKGQIWRDAGYIALAETVINAATIFGIGPQLAVEGKIDAAQSVSVLAYLPALYSYYRALNASYELAMHSISSPELNAHNKRQIAFHTTANLVEGILVGSAMYGIQYFSKKRGVEINLSNPPPYANIAENTAIMLFALLAVVTMGWCFGKKDLYDMLRSESTVAVTPPEERVEHSNPMRQVEPSSPPDAARNVVVEVRGVPEAVNGGVMPFRTRSGFVPRPTGDMAARFGNSAPNPGAARSS